MFTFWTINLVTWPSTFLLKLQDFTNRMVIVAEGVRLWRNFQNVNQSTNCLSWQHWELPPVMRSLDKLIKLLWFSAFLCCGLWPKTSLKVRLWNTSSPNQIWGKVVERADQLGYCSEIILGISDFKRCIFSIGLWRTPWRTSPLAGVQPLGRLLPFHLTSIDNEPRETRVKDIKVSVAW